jgi:hypothetical protein
MLKGVVATHSNQKVIKGYSKIILNIKNYCKNFGLLLYEIKNPVQGKTLGS